MAQSRTTPASGLRLTRRGRLFVFFASLIAVLGAATAFGQGAVAGDVSGGPATAIIVVQPGDTLWSVAQTVTGSADPRAVIEHIRSLNELEGSTVYPGQALVVPRAD